jgi:hypothetical protein
MIAKDAVRCSGPKRAIAVCFVPMEIFLARQSRKPRRKAEKRAVVVKGYDFIVRLTNSKLFAGMF